MTHVFPVSIKVWGVMGLKQISLTHNDVLVGGLIIESSHRLVANQAEKIEYPASFYLLCELSLYLHLFIVQ